MAIKDWIDLFYTRELGVITVFCFTTEFTLFNVLYKKKITIYNFISLREMKFQKE